MEQKMCVLRLSEIIMSKIIITKNKIKKNADTT